MFAFVIVDEAAGKLAAARDPCGIKPLYYATAADGEVVGFASELKGLLHLPNAERFDEFPPGHYWTDADGFSQCVQLLPLSDCPFGSPIPPPPPHLGTTPPSGSSTSRRTRRGTKRSRRGKNPAKSRRWRSFATLWTGP